VTSLLRLAIPRAALPAIEDAILELGGALWADTKGNPDPVPLEITLPAAVAAQRLTDALQPLAEVFGFTLPALVLEPLPERDWVAESQRNLPPQTAGRFWVHGSHVREAPPAGLIPLLVEASIAFGTGRHETTQGCLTALTDLADGGTAVRNALDLGCGSGVLAMAIAKLWPAARVLAADNDAPSVGVTRENAELNAVPRIVALESEGYAAPALRAAAPFDLIAANILAAPLIQLAPELARHLAPGGRAILSGLLTTQAAEVIQAHEAQGLTLVAARGHGEWDTLLLRK
jgi:ribosomal protein L11 methyltransferase